MRRTDLFRRLTIVFLCFFCIIKAPIAHAADQPLDLTASPTFFDLSLKSDSISSQKVRIRNNTSTALTLGVSVKKLITDPNGQVTLQDPRPEDAFINWLVLPNKSVTARPREWTDVKFSINVPQDAAFGYYYMLVFTPELEKNQQNQNKTLVQGQLAIPILMTVDANNAKISGVLTDFHATQAVSEYPPVTLQTQFQNTGNIHIKPLGTIFITDWRGKPVTSLHVNKEQGSVLPDTKRNFLSVWDDGFITRENIVEDGKVLTDSHGKPKTHLNIQFEKILQLRIGKYTAHEILVVSGKDRDIPFEANTTFYVFPWKIILGIIMLGIFLLIGFANTFQTIFRKITKLFRKS